MPPRLPEDRDALRRLPRRDLLDLARRAGIQGRSRLTKEALVRILAGSPSSKPGRTVLPGTPEPLSWEEAPLPEGFGEDRLVLMPIDPYWIHAYWELATESGVGARHDPEAAREPARTILRVYDVTSVEVNTASSFFDIELTPEARNWYINLWSPGKSLCAELGSLEPDGTFSPRVRSNVIHTPPAGVSAHAEHRWGRVRWSESEGPVFEPSGDPPEAAASRPGLASPGSTPNEPQVHLTTPPVSVPDLPATFRAPGGLTAVLRSPAVTRAEADRRALEETRRASVLGTDAPALPGDREQPQGGPGEDSVTGPSSGHWIGKGKGSRKAEG